MRKEIYLRSLFVILAVCLLVGCASNPISKNLRLEAQKDLTFENAAKDPDAHKGALVIWAGYIIDVVNISTYTEITVLDAPIESSGEPASAEDSQGRFLARIGKFLDPAVFRKNRRVTVAGRITGRETMPLGKIEYAYPVLDIEELHMWENDQPYQYYPAFDPWFGYEPFYPDDGFGHWRHEGSEHRH